MTSAQRRALETYRSRLTQRGMARFEVLGLDADRDLIKALARRLAENGPEAARLRAMVAQNLTGEPPRTGGLVAALRRSPMVGAQVDLDRSDEGREIDL